MFSSIFLSFNTQPPEGGWVEVFSVFKSQRLVSTHSRPKAAGSNFCSLGLCFAFQHTAARRRLALIFALWVCVLRFNTQPPEGGWGDPPGAFATWQADRFQHTAARRRLVPNLYEYPLYSCFNTQPPEGGWIIMCNSFFIDISFNTQPPEGGWAFF